MSHTYAEYEKSAQSIRSRIRIRPEIAIILGSGLGRLAERIEDVAVLPYGEIDGFPVSTNKAHAGKLYAGRLAGREVCALSGRFHSYEGYGLADTAYPVRVMKLLGVKTLITTNAAGGVRRDLNPGDLMLIADHINLSGRSPLTGKNLDKFGPRFPDMTDAYTLRLRDIAHAAAERAGVPLYKGVYAFMPGPQYETAAEIRMLAALGADAAGMSTVPEVITAAHCGMECLCISCITNMAAGIADGPLSDADVVETAGRAGEAFIKLMLEIVKSV